MERTRAGCCCVLSVAIFCACVAGSGEPEENEQTASASSSEESSEGNDASSSSDTSGDSETSGDTETSGGEECEGAGVSLSVNIDWGFELSACPDEFCTREHDGDCVVAEMNTAEGPKSLSLTCQYSDALETTTTLITVESVPEFPLALTVGQEVTLTYRGWSGFETGVGSHFALTDANGVVFFSSFFDVYSGGGQECSDSQLAENTSPVTLRTSSWSCEPEAYRSAIEMTVATQSLVVGSDMWGELGGFQLLVEDAFCEPVEGVAKHKVALFRL